MAGELPRSKFVSPAKCVERPWDLWVAELGRSAPKPDDAFAAPPAPDKGGGSRAHPYEPRRRAGLHRLRAAAMPLHGLLPQHEPLRAALCPACGALVACSAAARHLSAAHAPAPAAPPPPAAPRPRTRHKKDPPPPPAPPPSMLVAAPPAPPPALAPGSPPPRAAPPPELQVVLSRGELPVVSIQDPDELPLGDNLTDEIFEIMNSEGIQSADDLATATDWKNIIRDIGNLQDINFSQADAPHDPFAPALPPPAFLAEELTALQFAPTPPLAPPPAAAPRPPAAPSTPRSRNKPSKTKFNLREYDANKHCGVASGEGRPCTRSLTCKAHALSLRRLVEGRAKPFDTLLAEHRASREAGCLPPAHAAPAPAEPPPAIDLSVFNGYTTEQQVDDIYSLLAAEAPAALLDAGLALPPAPPPPEAAPPSPAERPERDRPERCRTREEPDVCWYTSCPRPLALCTFGAALAGGAVTVGKRFATVRANIKSSLSRSQCKATGGTNNFYYGQNSLSLSKSVHMSAGKTKPEVRRLIVCSGSGSGSGSGPSDRREVQVQQTLNELFGGERTTLNGHVGHSGLSGPKPRHKHSKHSASPVLDLGFPLDPLLADEKC